MLGKKTFLGIFSFSLFIFSEKERILSISIKYGKKEVVSGPLFRYVIVEKSSVFLKRETGERKPYVIFLSWKLQVTLIFAKVNHNQMIDCKHHTDHKTLGELILARSNSRQKRFKTFFQFSRELILVKKLLLNILGN